jgi:dGTPase
LAEALALAHDLGHPPFGHAGERSLHRAMSRLGGFDHNAQSLRVVTKLERKYWGFDGLNLTFETLEGLVKHNGPTDRSRQPLLAEAVDEAGLTDHMEDALEAPAEAQCAAIADDIAYNNHDIDDALRAGLVRFEELQDVPIVGYFARQVVERADGGDTRRAFYEINRRMITAMIEDVLAASRARIARLEPTSPDDVRRAGEPIVAFSPGMFAELQELRKFLFDHVYRHERVMRAMRGAESIVADLFSKYMDDPSSMPGERGLPLIRSGEALRMRAIGDFIAGMTDRFAVAEHRRLFDLTPDLG